jgi:competence protein ComEA
MGLDELLVEKQPESNLLRFLKKLKKFNFDEFLFKYRWPLTFLLIGAILIGLGVFFAKDELSLSSTKIEVLETNSGAQDKGSEIVVEVVGAVETPGVYKFLIGARVEDALIASGGVSADADRAWIEKFINRAAKLSDGQKVYVPRIGEEVKSSTSRTSTGSTGVGGEVAGGLININSASASELESLWGIGPVYAQNIIEQRPYSSVEELLTKKIIKKNVYERNKDKLTVY